MIFREQCNEVVRNDRSLVNSTKYPYTANNIRDLHKFDRMFNEFYARTTYYGDTNLDFRKLVKVYNCSFDRNPLGNSRIEFEATRDFLRQQIINAPSNPNQTATLDFISPRFRDVMRNTSPQELSKYIEIVDKTI
jgi:hypothetical protein